MTHATIAAPHPDPHAPVEFTPPPRACDAHCHVFGPASRFPFAPERSYTPPDSGIDKYERLRDRVGFSRAVFVQASCHGTDNAAMLDALGRGAGRYAGVAMIEDATTDDELDHMHRLGVRGIRFNFVEHLGGAPDLDRFWRLVERVAPRGWHVVLHLDADDLAERRGLLDRIPTSFVIDHMGRVPASTGLAHPGMRELLDLVTDERCWVKISGAERLTADGKPPYHDVVPIARALVGVAPDRILWGTDWPHPNVRHMPDDGDLVDLLADLVPDEEVREQVLVHNPARLYTFADRDTRAPT